MCNMHKMASAVTDWEHFLLVISIQTVLVSTSFCDTNSTTERPIHRYSYSRSYDYKSFLGFIPLILFLFLSACCYWKHCRVSNNRSPSQNDNVARSRSNCSSENSNPQQDEQDFSSIFTIHINPPAYEDACKGGSYGNPPCYDDVIREPQIENTRD